VAYHLGRDAPSAERLLFEIPQGGTQDLNGSKRAGAVLQQMAGRLKDAVTGGEAVADRRAPGLTHGVQVGVATSPRDSDAPAWLRFHGPRLVSTSSLKGADLD
jgi:hypothetical protein